MYGVPRLDAGTINLTMDPGSKWQTRGKSFITSLDFNHGGLVDTRKGHEYPLLLASSLGRAVPSSWTSPRMRVNLTCSM